jgi:predicted amidohydrolase YtcJ
MRRARFPEPQRPMIFFPNRGVCRRGTSSPGALAATLIATTLSACGGGTATPAGAPAGAAQPASVAADLVLTNGRVVTVDDARPEAEAVAIVGERIAAVGSSADIGRHIGPNTRVIDLGGRLAIPGFIEGHGHFMGLGQSKMVLDLASPGTWDEVVARVADAARQARPGEWILGRGWHQEKWEPRPADAIEGVPTHHALSRVSPDNPVILTHASGHASFVNARALELAGITRATTDPEGGTIVRDARGEATGLLRETAMYLVSRVHARAEAQRTPAEREAIARRQAELAAQTALANGITSFHDAGSPFSTVDFFRRLADEGSLPVRLYVMVRGDTADLRANLDRQRTIGHGNGFLTVRSIKLSIDGALGSHGAWLLEPYTDMPETAGLNTAPMEVFRRTAELAMQHGYQMNTHAIGDRGNREVLDVYERLFRANPDRRDLRWRIEHAQHLHPGDIPRFGQLGVIAAMQGVHATSDGPWVPDRIGHRRAEEGAYVWRSLWESGAVVTNGTDVPVEDISPIASFYSSVTRHMDTCQRFYPEQRMTREQALRSYTLNNAFAAFEEGEKGSITPGKLADIVVLSRDIMTVPEDRIRGTEVVYTIVGGQVRHGR